MSAKVMDLDRYRRAVSVLRLSGRDLNEEMVREGHAWAYRRYLGRPYASRYIGAEEEARREGRGLWRQANPHPPVGVQEATKRRAPLKQGVWP